VRVRVRVGVHLLVREVAEQQLGQRVRHEELGQLLHRRLAPRGAAAVGKAVRLLGVRSSRERAGIRGKQQWRQQ